MASSDAVKMLRAIVKGDLDAVDASAEKVDTQEDPYETGALIAAACFLAIERHFQPGQDLREITRFVTDLRKQYDAEDNDDLPPMATEAVIRAALGEDELIREIDPDVAVSVEMVLLHAIMSEEQLPDEELEAFVSEAVEIAARNL